MTVSWRYSLPSLQSSLLALLHSFEESLDVLLGDDLQEPDCGCVVHLNVLPLPSSSEQNCGGSRIVLSSIQCNLQADNIPTKWGK